MGVTADSGIGTGTEDGAVPLSEAPCMMRASEEEATSPATGAATPEDQNGEESSCLSSDS